MSRNANSTSCSRLSRFLHKLPDCVHFHMLEGLVDVEDEPDSVSWLVTVNKNAWACKMSCDFTALEAGNQCYGQAAAVASVMAASVGGAAAVVASSAATEAPAEIDV